MFRAVDIIRKKRDGQALTSEEIRWFITAVTQDEIADYQVAAWLMSVYFNGMSRQETVELTLAMAHSGHMMDLSDITDYAIDKHSSGGVGDKTTLVVLPLVAALGVPIAKMSGRGLGFSGGTLDKLEAIAGFNVRLSEEQFRAQARAIGLVLAGQTGELAPADGRLYALRDVTATVESLPLIASSIMSKKLAAGTKGIVLDVKVGRGAFMPTLEKARELAHSMVAIGVDAGRDMIAVVSDMNQPLGYAVGNALEVAEAIETLRGGGPEDFREHVLEVSRLMLKLAGRGKRWQSAEETREALIARLEGGAALAQFRRMVEAQGGDVKMVDHPEMLPQARLQKQLLADSAGYVQHVHADIVATAGLILGAGRQRKEDNVDLAVGLVIHVKVGDQINTGTPLLTIHANHETLMEEALELAKTAFGFSATPVKPLPLFYDIIEG